jgi:hypothetical protein
MNRSMSVLAKLFKPRQFPVNMRGVQMSSIGSVWSMYIYLLMLSILNTWASRRQKLSQRENICPLDTLLPAAAIEISISIRMAKIAYAVNINHSKLGIALAEANQVEYPIWKTACCSLARSQIYASERATVIKRSSKSALCENYFPTNEFVRQTGSGQMLGRSAAANFTGWSRARSLLPHFVFPAFLAGGDDFHFQRVLIVFLRGYS